MRPDFVSRFHDPSNGAPRIEAAAVTRGRAPRDPDDAPSREGMRAGRRRGWNVVEQGPSVSYSSLRRWLRSRAGRRWDDVWAEICSVSDARSRPGLRLRQEAESMVDRTTVRSDGRLCLRTGRSGSVYRMLEEISGTVPDEPYGPYVDARGILRYGETRFWRSRRDPDAADPDRVVLGKDRELLRLDGLWFEVGFGPVPPPRPADPPLTGSRGGGWDVLKRAWVFRPEGSSRRDRVAERMAVSKRALSSAELRRRGLENLHADEPVRRRGGRA